MEEEVIEVLYNICYGGWGISEKAVELYNLRNGNNNPITTLDSGDLCRHDPILIQIYKELGVEFNDVYAKIQIKKIPKIYENYYYIREYDGAESVNIDYTNYNKLNAVCNKIKEILQSSDDNAIKINEMTDFISSFKM